MHTYSYSKSLFGKLGQGASMVDPEVVHTDGPVTLLAVRLALGLASLIIADPAAVPPHNQEVANTVIANLFKARHGGLPSASRCNPLSHLSSSH
jgi:hypothetical protein